MEKKWKKKNTRGHKGNHTHTRFITFRVGQQSSDIRCRNAAGCIGVMEMAHWNPLDLIIYIYLFIYLYHDQSNSNEATSRTESVVMSHFA